jgi:hypothetical protein
MAARFKKKGNNNDYQFMLYDQYQR